jgi:hypothetical protein
MISNSDALSRRAEELDICAAQLVASTLFKNYPFGSSGFGPIAHESC